MKEKKSTVTVLNKKAYHDYFIEETLEAGLSLSGCEIKSIRAGRCALKDAYVKTENGEAYVYNMHISPYEQGNIFNLDPLRARKLLLHKTEIRKITGAVTKEGLAVVALKIYFVRDRAKLLLGFAKGKKLYDKRAAEALKTVRREAQKAFKASL